MISFLWHHLFDLLSEYQTGTYYACINIELIPKSIPLCVEPICYRIKGLKQHFDEVIW